MKRGPHFLLIFLVGSGLMWHASCTPHLVQTLPRPSGTLPDVTVHKPAVKPVPVYSEKQP